MPKVYRKKTKLDINSESVSSAILNDNRGSKNVVDKEPINWAIHNISIMGSKIRVYMLILVVCSTSECSLFNKLVLSSLSESISCGIVMIIKGTKIRWNSPMIKNMYTNPKI